MSLGARCPKSSGGENRRHSHDQPRRRDRSSGRNGAARPGVNGLLDFADLHSCKHDHQDFRPSMAFGGEDLRPCRC